MYRSILRLLLLVLMVSLLAAPVAATTWAPVKVECPICQTRNDFRDIMSSGSYIYSWPSRFQYVFWPYTTGQVLYSCKRCHLTTFMEHFAKVPKERHQDILKQLEGVKFDKEYERYTGIPMSQRLAVAEKVYSVLNKGDYFWSHFYRVMGYHLEREKRPEDAMKARQKALVITEKMIANKDQEQDLKELLLISGAMRHYLKDDKGSLSDFQRALQLKYHHKESTSEQNEGVDKYLTELLNQYIQEIKTPKEILTHD